MRVIGIRPQQITTDSLELELPTRQGAAKPDPENDVAKLAVWDRYRPGAKPALGFIKGLGLRRGAVSSTVSHDSHNLISAGASDEDMLLSAKRTAEIEGGLTVCLDGRVLAEMPLPLGGLMSVKTLEETTADYKKLMSALPELGFPEGADPFMTLGFMSLPVIPRLKLTASGLVDTELFKVVPLFV